MLVTRARANSSKNHTLLMCRIWKMGRNLFSSLDIRDNFKVAYLEKNSNNPKIYLVTITVWGTGSVINWVNLSCWLPDLKVDIWQNLPKKCHFQIISHVQWWTNFFFHFCILHIKNVWILLKLEMALVTTIEMKFALVWEINHVGKFLGLHECRRVKKGQTFWPKNWNIGHSDSGQDVRE